MQRRQQVFARGNRSLWLKICADQPRGIWAVKAIRKVNQPHMDAKDAISHPFYFFCWFQWVLIRCTMKHRNQGWYSCANHAMLIQEIRICCTRLDTTPLYTAIRHPKPTKRASKRLLVRTKSRLRCPEGLCIVRDLHTDSIDVVPSTFLTESLQMRQDRITAIELYSW